MNDRHLRLPDGRRLAWAEYGAPDGAPIIYCHGNPGSRLDWAVVLADDLFRRHGVRVIAPDRPGLGGSDPAPGRRLLDWAGDVAELAGHMGLAHLRLLGYSIGCAYALACARALPDRVLRVAVAGAYCAIESPDLTRGMGPAQRFYLESTIRRPGVHRLLSKAMLSGTRLPPWPAAVAMRPFVPPADRPYLHRLAPQLLKTVREGASQSVEHLREDAALVTCPWDFRPEEVQVPVDLWHGEADPNTAPAMGRYLAARLPRCQARFLPGEGHVSMLFRHLDRILERLLGR